MKKYVIAGASFRCYYMFAKNLTEKYRDKVSIEGIYDPNITRSEFFNKNVDGKIKVYASFDEMMKAVKPDAVIVTTVDSFHHEYIIKALEYGCDAISEKPMTTDEVKCKAITDAERKSGKKVYVTFNMRFTPYFVAIKELMMKKVLGRVLNVNYEHLLGKWHGADYFRRWHSNAAKSGSLLVHKSTHHLDIVNWLLDDTPQTVTALGSLHYYGRNREMYGKRCADCAHKKSCEYYYDVSADSLCSELYVKAEKNDGYMRDACPFRDGIDIYDNMSLSVRYKKGALLTYNLTTYNPYEGYKITVTGTDGRLEAYEVWDGAGADDDCEIKLFETGGKVTKITFPKAGGAHSGGDERLLKMLFEGGIEDKLGQCASSFDGAASALIGICAKKSIETGKAVDIEQYLDKLK